VGLLLLVLQSLILVAGLAMFGKAVVGAFNWKARQSNVVYQLFAILTRPLERVVRLVTPKLVLDQHVPLATFLLLLVGYFAMGFWHRDVCLVDLAQAGCERWAVARGASQ